VTHREKRWLAVGILAGFIVAVAAAAGLFLHLQRTKAPETAIPATATSDSASAVSNVTNDAMQTASQLSAEEQAKIGLQITEIRPEAVTQDILAIGRVEEPETSVATVSTRFGGRIERLFVNFTGQPVQKGDPVATIAITGQPAGKDDPVSSIYSRELIAAAEEYKFALENREHAHSSSRPEAAGQADALVEASRIRLSRWGLTPDQVDKLLAAPEQPIRITVNAEFSGIVRSRKVAEGQFVNPGDALVDLTDLRTVWVKADVFDSDLARIRPGLPGTISSEALPGLKLSGTVQFIDPHSDPQTRTTPVRIQVDNPGIRLKPGMIVQAAFHISLGTLLTVPREAVIDSGTEKIVYIARDNGVFQQQRIQVGTAPLKDRFAVTDGLMRGDKVVTKGAFLVDSQTRLTGGLTGLFGGSKSFSDSGASATATGGHAFKMTFRIEPDPPRGANPNTIHVALVDAAGKPVTDAQVRLTFVMPAMPAMNMPEMRNNADLKWAGSEYTGPIQIMMAGGWNVSIEARRGDELLATAQTHINAR
jgi:Cu(I)/Ag(I) efflux system membrane fusion protein/cobalt-zinc-cadmium efflux system membrane fusion protein